jgi:flagellar biosynthesis/type III secretory pathway M-ring protein FliF/YscJ
MVYAVFNTIDPVEVDPYANAEEETEEESGCTAKTDPSSFWLSFSSILLGVALVFAILMLVVKNIRRRRKANASDAKSHFKVTSRVSSKKDAKKEVKTVKVEEPEEVEQEIIEEEVVESEEKEEALDDYVYGDVQDFGENDNNEDKE